ncbi:hypothetical protein CJ030_MR3G012329 [Morella rubra]|uniref:Myb/SANT-like domain-containing protein n=1 Tax=Morella rubra TaxID=262757 RepID=A0A6A1W3P7_9ROSI|nr:hypothetical protein CJ030_MR3G012329 [Morella rubra]
MTMCQVVLVMYVALSSKMNHLTNSLRQKNGAPSSRPLEEQSPKLKKFLELLRTPSGFGWNPETNTVSAAKEAWQNYLEKHPEAQKFRKQGCADYNLLGLIFNASTATGMGAHGSSKSPTDVDTEDALEEWMQGGIHADITGGEATSVGNECNTRIEGGLRIDSGTHSGATRQIGRARKKKLKQGEIANDTFLAMAENCRVGTEATRLKMEGSTPPSGEGSSRFVGNSMGNHAIVQKCLEACQQFGTPQTHERNFIVAA